MKWDQSFAQLLVKRGKTLQWLHVANARHPLGRSPKGYEKGLSNAQLLGDTNQGRTDSLDLGEGGACFERVAQGHELNVGFAT